VSIPGFPTLMLPLLRLLGDEKEWPNVALRRELANQFGLSEDEQQQVFGKHPTPRFTNRVAWAIVHLKRAGLIQSPTEESLRITPNGLDLLSRQPERITFAILKGYTDYTKGRSALSDSAPADAGDEQPTTPEEALEASYQSIRDKLADELLSRVRNASARRFEEIVLELLVAMGYGGSVADAAQAVGGPRDGGIDGLIKEDKLGLDVICVQAKRWKETVGRPIVQAFAGSMEAVKARKGVLITTSAFSPDAKEYVSRIDRKIVLVDGPTLAGLMIDHDVGVTTSRQYVVKKIDSDYLLDVME
jgi:restriction system protein